MCRLNKYKSLEHLGEACEQMKAMMRNIDMLLKDSSSLPEGVTRHCVSHYAKICDIGDTDSYFSGSAP
jgi:hypothetical protein